MHISLQTAETLYYTETTVINKRQIIDNHGQKAKKEWGELLFNKEKPLLNFFLAGLLNHCTL